MARVEGEKLAEMLECVLSRAWGELDRSISGDVPEAMVEALIAEFSKKFWSDDPLILVRVMVEAGEAKIASLNHPNS